MNTTKSESLPSLQLSYQCDIDTNTRPIPAERLLLPWTATLPTPPQPPAENKNIPGDWARGKELFYSQQVNCIACHIMRGEGGTLGPDLTNLIHKSADSVLADIIAPNASVNPDYIAYRVALRNGDILSGLVASEDATHLRITEGVGKSTLVNRSDVLSLAPTDISIMPTGFKDLGQEKLDDLLRFLTTEPAKK